MFTDTSLAPQFLVFHYFIRWFIQNFGIIAYFIAIVGGIGAFCLYALAKSIKTDEWDRAALVLIFACILIGGLVGLGMDISNGYAFSPRLR